MLKEKRIANFCIRSAFHDWGTVPPKGTRNEFAGCNGGLCLFLEDLIKLENSADQFSAHAAKVISFAAETYSSSYVDAIGVCAMVGIKMLQGPEFYSIPVGKCIANAWLT
jgi:Peroxidase